MFFKELSISDEQIDKVAQRKLEAMSLKEKVWLLNGNYDVIGRMLKYKNAYNPIPIKTSGNKRLGIPPLAFTDGPRGVVMGHSTCFPVSMARGASFDRELERRVGDVIGIESRAQGANLFAGVCINLLMHPAWGRAQETYGEEPFHVGEMGKALTEGVQKHNVMACVKHYALNNIENSRFYVDVDLEERTLREVYLPHFKKCIDAGAASVMGSYNKFRGEQACESKHLLTTVLRDEWGFEGFSISDFFFGVRDTKSALEAGLDVEMPMPIEYQQVLQTKVEAGEIDIDYVNKATLRLIKTLMVFKGSKDPMIYKRKQVASKEHTKLAKEVAEKSMVLIKNDHHVLPFKKGAKKIMVAGRLARQANTGDRGSSQIFAPYVVTLLDGLRARFGEDAQILFCKENEIEKAKRNAPKADAVIIVAGNDYNDEGEYLFPDKSIDPIATILKGYKNQGMPIRKGIMSMASKKMLGAFAPEGQGPMGGDRSNLSLRQKEIDLINEIAPLNKNTVVTLVCGSMVMTKEWEDNVAAILYGWYSGMEGGNALCNILFGDVNPSGKLPFAIPTDINHLHDFDNTKDTAYYDFYHGYRKLDQDNNPPAYPFGYGMGYTTYAYEDAKVMVDEASVWVKVNVKNTGQIDGEEVVQVYVSVPKSKVKRHKQILKGFDKVAIKAGETITVSIEIPKAELRFYNEDSGLWELEHTEYIIKVGPYCHDQVLVDCPIEL